MALTRLGLNQSVNLTNNVTGALPIANGGTNLTSGFINGTTAVGKTLQVVNAVQSTEYTRTATSFGASSTGVTITPSATSSKVLIQIHCGQIGTGNDNDQGITAKLVRSIGGSDTDLIAQLQNNAGAFTNLAGSVYRDFTGHASLSYLDSPNTTSATQYRIYIKCRNTNTFVGVQIGSSSSTFTAMEIGA